MRTLFWSVVAVALALAAAPAVAQTAAKPSALNIAIVTFFSGSGAVVGGPTVDGAKMAIESINQAGGVDGVPIHVRFIDEAGGPTKQVAELRSIAGKVAAVLGYASSANCLAVAPVAEQLGVLTVMSDCDTNSLFQGHSYRWIFRTIPPASSNAVAMALYVAKMYPKVTTIAGLNPDYAFGRDEWKYFTEAMQKLNPQVKLGTALFPELFAGHYTAELSRLESERPNLIYSSLWGGDVVAMIQQGLAQGVFSQGLVALAAGTQGDVEGMKALPNGVVVGAEHGYLMHPGAIKNPEVAKFVEEYHKRTNSYPLSPYPFTIQRAILALADGYKAAVKTNGGAWPTSQEVAKAMAGLTVPTMMGNMTIEPDHQAEWGEQVGISVHAAQYPFAVLNQIVTFTAEMINPPMGENVDAWISKMSPNTLSQIPAPAEYHP
jgi:branched-chain amino acid transport system substrate-binding protein